ncbi:GlsB/YeaQ/YmgE family stress response membrane protein [Brucella intermedia]|uniref:GlsB/YeaQ/YmgE family stress response membrane protein n=1 Tax=Brucella intermedia TaxID=94625 RepID=A0A7V6PGK0_9HYPH|nr:GlsB/YeaQ/YmgE family stress response membrane protein [Brucella intermedia]KAB2719757.1 GlsB/YeaQ/YmgE family stress response membrane protein [Brucella intermedia]HHV70574.1 GlsB/YeaQ/YmgE family stress response membrane protein [Brucella intermedia]
MSVISWIILGLIAGFIGSKIVNKSGQGLFLDIALGIVGAIVGGVISSQLLGRGVTGAFDPISLVIAIIGSIIVLWVYHAITGKRSIG